ncbi:MAG: hypothetical protein WCC32_18445 [Terriglobales bacterium]
MDSWLRIAIFAVILLSFVRRLLKSRARIPAPPSQVPSPRGNLPSTMQNEFPSTMQNEFPSTTVPPMARTRYGKKNDFRDVPPPPENPDLG